MGFSFHISPFVQWMTIPSLETAPGERKSPTRGLSHVQPDYNPAGIGPLCTPATISGVWWSESDWVGRSF
jgi:hypothetical protein